MKEVIHRLLHESLIHTAEQELREYGCNDEAIAEVRKIAEEHGEAGVKAYMAGVKRYGTPDPTDEDGTVEGGNIASNDVPEVAAYADNGPQAVALARQFVDQYNNAPLSVQRSYTREDYVKANMKMALNSVEKN